MKVVVVGCGVVGVTTAWFCHAAGMEVEIVDRAAAPASETSFANGALLHPSYVAPWNEPGIHWQLLRMLGREDAPMLLRPKHVFRYAGWGCRFVLHSRYRRFLDSARRNVFLAGYSAQVQKDLRGDLELNYGHESCGSLQVFRDKGELMKAARAVDRTTDSTVRYSVIGIAELINLEPALAEIGTELVGAIHFPDDERGDPHRYCLELAARLTAVGITPRFRVDIQSLVMERNRVKYLKADSGVTISGDAYVLACASETRGLVRPLGIRLPVMPVKGYTLTVPRDRQRQLAPHIPIVDADLHAAVTPLSGDKIRVAGTAEFSGNDLRISDARISNLFGLLQRIFPSYAKELENTDLQPWAGLRPMSVDGVPLIGRLGAENLFINTGHGQIGWTTGPGSAKLLADELSGRQPQLKLAEYSPMRFQRLSKWQ